MYHQYAKRLRKTNTISQAINIIVEAEDSDLLHYIEIKHLKTILHQMYYYINI